MVSSTANDGSNVINETLNGNSYATNVMGADGYVSRKQNGTTGYLFKDAHGDVLSAYSSTTNKIADYTYDAWGEKKSVGDYTWGKENPIRYNGQYYDTESGMTYLRARYYDSDIRRFITEDPIKDGLNWYSYAGNNPVMMCDPSGLFDYNTKLTYNPNDYSNDIKVLQNELAWNGYLNDSDIDGYFGQNTLAAVNQYKYDNGLWNDGEYYGVVGLTTWKHLGLIYREQIDIDAGVQIMTTGAKQCFDISEAVNLAVIRATGGFQQHKGDLNWFKGVVGDNGKWNIKANANVWASTLGISTNSYKASKTFYGRPVTIDDVGNITYGYLGTAAGISPFALGVGSTLNHFKNHGVNNWNNEMSDQSFISLGISWYAGYDIQVRIH